MLRVLVTGATGFLGRRLTYRLLSDGLEVTAIHRPSTSRGRVDELRSMGVRTVAYEDYPELQAIGKAVSPDIVFHLAAQQPRIHAPGDVEPLLGANISMGTHLLEGLSSTDCVFVNALSYFQFRENQPAPYSLYSASKQAFLELTRFYGEERGIDVRQVVLYDNFGPGDTRDKLIPQLIESLRDRTPIELGPSDQSINALYIDDVVDGLVAAGKPGNVSTVAVRAAASTTVGEIVGELERIAGRQILKTYDDTRVASDRESRSGVWPLPAGWHPRTTLAEGLERTLSSSAE